MSSYENWWLEHREISYWRMRTPLLYSIMLSRVFDYLFLADFCFDEISLCQNLLLGVICMATILSEKWLPNYKHIILVILCEVSTIFSQSFSSSNNAQIREALLMKSIVTTLIFEVSLIQNMTLVCLLPVKYAYTLYVYFASECFSSQTVMAPLLSSILTIIAVTLYESNKRHSIFLKCQSQTRQENLSTKLEAIIQSVPEGLFVMNLDMKILLHNASLSTLLSTSAKSSLKSEMKTWKYSHSRRSYHLMPEHDYFFQDLNHYLNSSSIAKVKFGVIHYAGNYLNLCGSKVIWDNQIAVIITAREITALIQLEESKAELKYKTALLRSVSHELRAPTTAIITFSDQIEKNEKGLSDEGKAKIHMVNVCSNMLLHLENDLLDYSQLIAGTFKISKRDFLLRDLLTDVCGLVKTQCFQKNLDFRLVIDDLLPQYANTDPNRLSQIVLNLLTNALKFTFTGYIKMICEFTILSNLRVTIIDTGIGIPPTQLQKLFQEFGKLHSSSINPQGCGLGLYISNMLVQTLGGNGISVVSTPNKGSEFTFEVNILDEESTMPLIDCVTSSLLPIEREDVIYLPTLNILGSYSNKFPRILIVDDNCFIIQILSSLLSKLGYMHECARSGKQAYKNVKYRQRTGFQYQVIIMDCEMPEMDGWTASVKIQKLWESGKISSLPSIIAHTAYIGEEDRKRCIDSGMKDCIFKPTSEVELRSIMNKYLF